MGRWVGGLWLNGGCRGWVYFFVGYERFVFIGRIGHVVPSVWRLLSNAAVDVCPGV